MLKKLALKTAISLTILSTSLMATNALEARLDDETSRSASLVAAYKLQKERLSASMTPEQQAMEANLASLRLLALGADLETADAAAVSKVTKEALSSGFFGDPTALKTVVDGNKKNFPAILEGLKKCSDENSTLVVPTLNTIIYVHYSEIPLGDETVNASIVDVVKPFDAEFSVEKVSPLLKDLNAYVAAANALNFEITAELNMHGFAVRSTLEAYMFNQTAETKQGDASDLLTALSAQKDPTLMGGPFAYQMAKFKALQDQLAAIKPIIELYNAARAQV